MYIEFISGLLDSMAGFLDSDTFPGTFQKPINSKSKSIVYCKVVDGPHSSLQVPTGLGQLTCLHAFTKHSSQNGDQQIIMSTRKWPLQATPKIPQILCRNY